MSETSRALHEPWPSLSRQREAVSFGVWAFLASELLFFGGLFLTYGVYRNLYPHGFVAAARETDVFFGTLNTAVLMTSSLTMAVAVRAAESSMRRLTVWCLALTAVLGLAFLVVKGFEYHDDIVNHLVPGQNFKLHERGAEIFWAFYWIATAVHAIHLTVGIVIVTAVAALVYHRALPLRSPRYEGVALYWHLVDIIWVILLPLLYLVGRAS
jgi:cytochrome c oxidase subunit III